MRTLIHALVAGLALLLTPGARSAAQTIGTAASDPLAVLASEITSGRHPGIEGLVIVRDGHVLASSTSPGLTDEGLDIRSATKSVTALLIGIAQDRGYLGSLDQPVIERLPEYAKWLRKDPRKARIRISDLLTMRSGLDCDDWNPESPGHEDRMYRRRDWIRFWARTPMRSDPGSEYAYCTGNVIALGRLLANAVGKPVPEFAQEALFAPLGITRARWAQWNGGRDADTGGHLRIHPRDLARIGELVLGGGSYHGARIVSTGWIAKMTTEHTDIPGRGQRYGYLWWLDQTRNPALPATRLQMAWGNGGNFLIVLPELSTVVAFAGSRYNRDDALEPLIWMRDRVLPALGSSSAKR